MEWNAIRKLINEYLEQRLAGLLNTFVPRRYLNQKQAIRYTGTSAATLNEWRDHGMKVIIFGEKSRPKYDVKDLDEWMDNHKV